jgi:hypothetical protein
MPRTLHAELARRAETEGTSLNQYITDALARSVGWGRAEAEEEARTSSRGVVLALVANAVVIGLAAVAAVAVLVVALLG